MHILFTRPLEDGEEIILKFRDLGHKVSHMPVIQIEKVEYEKINFSDYKAIIFTSANALKFLDTKLIDKKTFNSVQAERNVLKVLEGDCETAVGAISEINNENITLQGELFSLDGKERFYCKSSRDINSAAELGIEIGENLKKQSKGNYKK